MPCTNQQIWKLPQSFCGLFYLTNGINLLIIEKDCCKFCLPYEQYLFWFQCPDFTGAVGNVLLSIECSLCRAVNQDASPPAKEVES